jgi:hypothetical protein
VEDHTCSVTDCTGPSLARGLCSKHYQQWRLHKLEGVATPTITACHQCGSEFRRGRSDQIYCSLACRIGARPVKVRPAPPDVECRFCHKMFTPRKVDARTLVCMSDECRRARSNEAARRIQARKVASRAPRICKECGAEFKIKSNSAYCSPACLRESTLRRRRDREYRPAPINCVECGQQIPYKSGKRRFCGDECWKLYRDRTSRWRVKGLWPDHGMVEACALCVATERLDIDHDHACCPGDRSCGKCVRGFLCRSHNVGLGMFGDDPAQLRAAADYIERHRAALKLKEYVNG